MSEADAPELTEAERRARSRKVYRSVVRTVNLNTGRVQPPLARKTSIMQTATQEYPTGDVESAISAALRNGDLFQVTIHGTVRLGIDDVDALRSKVSSWIEYRDDPSQQILAATNQRISHLKE